MPLPTTTKIDLISTDPAFFDINAAPEPEDTHLYYTLGGDYQKYLEMRRDARIRSLLTKRRQAILGRRVLFEYPRGYKGNNKGIELATQVHDAMKYESMCSAMLNTGMLIGFAVVQLDYVLKDDLVIAKHKLVPQHRWTFRPFDPNADAPNVNDEPIEPDQVLMVQDYEVRLLTKRAPITGERVPKTRFMIYTFDSDGSPWGLGLGYTLYPLFVVKREAMKAWLLNSDRAGSPPIYGTHPPEYSEDDPETSEVLRRFENLLRAVSPNGWARLPDGFATKVAAEISGLGPEVHEKLIAMADSQMSIAVLGEVQYSDKLTGSYAANQSQVDDREASLTDADVNLLDEQMNDQLWVYLADYNLPARARMPIVRRETIADFRKAEQAKAEQDAKASQRQADNTLVQMGLQPTEEYIKETYGDGWVKAVDGSGGAGAAPAGVPADQPIGVSLKDVQFGEVLDGPSS